MMKKLILFSFIFINAACLKAQEKWFFMGTASFSNQSEYYDNLPVFKNPNDWELSYNAVIDYRIKERFLIGIYSGLYYFNRQYDIALFRADAKTYSYGVSTGYVSRKFLDERFTYQVIFNYYLHHTRIHIEANGVDNRTTYQYGNGLSLMPGITFWATKHFGVGFNLNFTMENKEQYEFDNEFNYFKNPSKYYFLKPQLNLFLSL